MGMVFDARVKDAASVHGYTVSRQSGRRVRPRLHQRRHVVLDGDVGRPVRICREHMFRGDIHRVIRVCKAPEAGTEENARHVMRRKSTRETRVLMWWPTCEHC